MPSTRESAQALRQKGHHAFDLTSNLDESQVRAVFEGVGVNTADMDRETFWRMVRCRRGDARPRPQIAPRSNNEKRPTCDSCPETIEGDDIDGFQALSRIFGNERRPRIKNGPRSVPS